MGDEAFDMSNTSLERAFSDLEDKISDFTQFGYQNVDVSLAAIAECVDRDPLRSIVNPVIDETGFDSWWKHAQESKNPGSAGSGTLAWPNDLGERVGVQASLLGALAAGEIKLLSFAFDFCYVGSGRSQCGVCGFL